jgi:hypothetical protein
VDIDEEELRLEEEDDEDFAAPEDEEDDEDLLPRSRRGKRARGTGGSRRGAGAALAWEVEVVPQRSMRVRSTTKRVAGDYVDPLLLDLDNEEALYGPQEPKVGC